MLTKKQVSNLIDVDIPLGISIYMPVHRQGQEVLQHHDEKQLKNLFRDVKVELKRWGMQDLEIDQLVQPILDLLHDYDFWKAQEDGLALFLSPSGMEVVRLPFSVTAAYYVAGSFYLLPLLTAMSQQYRFYLLELHLDEARLYKVRKYEWMEKQIAHLIPEREAVVGGDYEEKSLQMRAQPSASGEVLYHGHGEGKDDVKEETVKYFRSVNKAINTLLADESAPLVVAALDHQFAMYKSVNTYQGLWPEVLAGNAAYKDKAQITDAARILLKDYLSAAEVERKERLEAWRDTPRTNDDIHTLLPDAMGGRVDTLFLRGGDIFGLYDPSTQEVKVEPEKRRANVSLLNLLGVQVFKQGGKLYEIDPEQLDWSAEPVVALYRY